jgi:putative Mg2+ transporter-C (MgtC) family protein
VEQLEHVTSIAGAYALAIPIGWDREKADRNVGLRTFPLVAMAACAFALLGMTLGENGEAASKVIEGIVSGVGFLGAAAVVKRGVNVKGTATAAAIWATAALGIACAMDEWAVAALISAIGFITLRYLNPRGDETPPPAEKK